MSAENTIHLLRKHPAFENAELSFLTKLAPLCRIIKLSDQQILFAERDHGSTGYLVLHGVIRLFSELQKTQTTRLVGKDESFADPLLFGVKVYPISAEAIGPTEVLEIPQDPVMNGIRQYPELALSMLMSLSVRLRQHIQTIRMLTLPNPSLRLLIFLQESSKKPIPSRKGWYELDMVLKRKDLALRIHIAPETLSRILKTLQKERLLELHNHRIRYVHALRLMDGIKNRIRSDMKD